MPRRIPDYPDAFEGWNEISSIGSYIGFASAILFVYIIFHTLKFGKKCGNDPWQDVNKGLEWTLPSPPNFHSYDEIPVVK